MPQRNTPRRDGRGRGFENSERLRELLTRLDAEGPDAWRNDPVATELMRYAADKYAALARKHGLDPWEAATAAFEAMRAPSVRRADDPWAVITRAVQITCIAENRANGLLCSVHQARRPRYSSTTPHSAPTPSLTTTKTTLTTRWKRQGRREWSQRSKTQSHCCAGTGGNQWSPARRSSASAHASQNPSHEREHMNRCGVIVTPGHSSISPHRPGIGCCASSSDHQTQA